MSYAAGLHSCNSGSPTKWLFRIIDSMNWGRLAHAAASYLLLTSCGSSACVLLELCAQTRIAVGTQDRGYAHTPRRYRRFKTRRHHIFCQVERECACARVCLSLCLSVCLSACVDVTFEYLCSSLDPSSGVQKSQGDICDIVVYSAVISSCSKCARWQTALGLLQDFERSAAQAQAQAAQAANAQTYNAAMLACVTGHAWRTAAALALQMQLQQVETDVIASCTLVGAFVAGTQPVQTAACMDLLHHRALAAMPA